MSKPKYWWYGNVLRTIRHYPILAEVKADKQGQSVTANYSGMPKGGGAGRTTENCAVRQLSPREEEELDAVRMAIDDIGRQRDGGEILKIVKLVDWEKTHTVDGSAMELHMHVNTAKSRRSRFIRAVAKNMKYF